MIHIQNLRLDAVHRVVQILFAHQSQIRLRRRDRLIAVPNVIVVCIPVCVIVYITVPVTIAVCTPFSVIVHIAIQIIGTNCIAIPIKIITST